MWRVVLGVVISCWAAQGQDSRLREILREELDRNFAILKTRADPAVYYLAYSVVEQETESVTASLGAIIGSNRRHNRTLDITLRVGSPKLDNYHTLPGGAPRFTTGASLVLEDNANAIKRRVWEETDRCYRLAAQRLINIRTSKEVRVADAEAADDFSTEDVVRHVSVPPKLEFSRPDWTRRLRKLSAEFGDYGGILSSTVAVQAGREVKCFVNSEGSEVIQGRTLARLTMSATAKAADGMDLQTSDSFSATEARRLPKDDELSAAIKRIAGDLVKLQDAPLVEPYVGPAILSGRAAGVFFHEIFGHRVEGHRLRDDADGQTFAKSVGAAVLPGFLSVVFDPTARQAAGEDLNGWYEYDDEGVQARRVVVVDKGILKTFLMCRTPLKDFPRSNGHGRRQPGAEVVARQSNLIVEAAQTVPDSRLKELLIEEVKRQNKPYGLYFRDITGGFTTTDRRGINAFKVLPLVVFRVYPDGREELVRGADIVGTPLASFAKIVAAGDRPGVFNGFCGAESGDVPVAAVSPALLVSEIEIQKRESSRDRPPLLPAPRGGDR